MRRWRPTRGDAARLVVSDASHQQQLGGLVDEIGLSLEAPFASLDAVIFATSAIAESHSLLERYTKARP